MDEKIIPIELNPKVIRDYYHSKSVYKDKIKKANISRLLIALALLATASIISYFSSDKHIIIIVFLIMASIISAFSFSNYMIKRWAWLINLRTMSSSYKNMGDLYLKVNENGIGILNEAGEVFNTWNKIKSFKIDLDFMFIYYSDKSYNMFPLTNLDSNLKDFIVNKLIENGSVNNSQDPK